MKKYMHGEFSPEKLRKVEGRINCYYSRARTDRLVLFIVACVYCLIQGVGYSLSIRYVGDFYEGISFERFVILKDIQNILDGWVFKGYGLLNLAFPLLIMIAVSIVSCLAASFVAVVLNLIKMLLFTGMSVRPIPDKNQVEKIKALIERISKIRKIYDPDIHFSVVVIFSYLIATAYPVYSAVEYIGEITSDNILAVFLIAGISLLVLVVLGTIPLLLSFLVVTNVNSYFPRKMSPKLHQIEKVLDNWWVDTDPQERERRAKEAREYFERKKLNELPYPKNYFSDTKTSVPEHGPLATATNCGMPWIDVSDM